ncbi:MAG: nicotinamide riboside transporter PnuC [Actinomycetes bacterium]
MHLNFMATFITAWGYHLTYLELIAFITSVIGVGLGVFGPRSTWPWWNISSLLYAALFYEQKYYASAALQFIFIAGGFWGWFGWGAKGATPAKVSRNEKIIWGAVFIISWGTLYPFLKRIGAAASLTDAFGFVGSCIAQILMVIEKYESWPLWFVVDGVYTYQFWRGGSYLTAILYFIFVLIAVAGWKRWLKEASK